MLTAIVISLVAGFAGGCVSTYFATKKGITQVK